MKIDIDTLISKIKGMMLLSDSAVDITIEREIKRAEITGYNKAIQDVCKVLKAVIND